MKSLLFSKNSPSGGEESETGSSLSLRLNGTRCDFHLRRFQLLIQVPLATAISSLGLQSHELILSTNAG